MIIDTIFERLLLLAALLCTINAGFLFAFAVVVMPGLAQLSDKEFIKAFQKIDGVIQKGQVLFVLVWLGSAASLIAATILGFSRLEPLEMTILTVACIAYLVGVQASTFKINIPLNNRLQALDVQASSGRTLTHARFDFEPTWNTWNQSRAVIAVLVSLLLMMVV